VHAFPISGVGINWTYHFSQKHTNRIKISRSRALEDKHGRAANPHTNDAWWKLLGDVLKQYQIKPKNLYGTDEVGMQAQGQGKHVTYCDTYQPSNIIPDASNINSDATDVFCHFRPFPAPEAPGSHPHLRKCSSTHASA
jgi:hypothetical protein